VVREWWVVVLGGVEESGEVRRYVPGLFSPRSACSRASPNVSKGPSQVGEGRRAVHFLPTRSPGSLHRSVHRNHAAGRAVRSGHVAAGVPGAIARVAALTSVRTSRPRRRGPGARLRRHALAGLRQSPRRLRPCELIMSSASADNAGAAAGVQRTIRRAAARSASRCSDRPRQRELRQVAELPSGGYRDSVTVAARSCPLWLRCDAAPPLAAARSATRTIAVRHLAP